MLIAHDTPVRPYARVLGAVTFAPASVRGLALAARLAPEAELHAIHALQLPLGARLGPEPATDSAPMAEAEARRAAFMRADGLPARLPLPEIVPGGVHEVLNFRMAELDPDLLVIGSQSGRDPGALGNYARDLMRAPPADVLVAKPD